MLVKIKTTVGTILEIAGVLGLTGLAIKAECERHKTKKKLIDTELKLAFEQLSGTMKDIIIRQQKEQIEALKGEEKAEEEA